MRDADALRRERDHYRRIALETGNRRLHEAEVLSGIIAQLRRAERDLQQARDELEERVRLRTAELVATNERLRREIAERQRVEAELRAFWENSIIGVYRATPDGRVEMANPALARMLGYQGPDELRGLALDSDFYEPDFPRQMFRESLAREGRVVAFESRWRRRDGATVWVRENAHTIRDTDGTVRYHDGAVEDISEIKRADEQRLRLEEQMRENQKLESLGVLAGGIAHDFNNLLTSILGNASLVLHDLPQGIPARVSLDEIDTAARRASELCRQMLAYSGRGQFVIEDIRINGLTEGMMQLLRASLSRQARLRTNLGPGLPLVRGDATQLRQVLMNLLINASEALGDREGEITISTGWGTYTAIELAASLLGGGLGPGPYVWLEVSDTGCGMDSATQRRIFEPFFTTKFTGRGMGLSAVLGIVRGHKGTLFLDSQPGRGTSFRVLLPRAAARGHPDNRPLPPEDAWEPIGTVLLVDDEEPVLRIGRRLIERMGPRVLTARDGTEALEVYRAHREEIRAVLLDYTMPGPSALETLRALRELDAGVRVALVSGYAGTEVRAQLAGQGIVSFIAKPYNLEELRRRLRELMTPTP